MKKRILSGFLAVVMCGSLTLPVTAVAGTGQQNAVLSGSVSGEGGPVVEAFADTGRQTLNFNKDWRFQLGEVKGAEAKDYDDSEWRALNLPHDYSIENDFDTYSEAKSGGGFLDGGVAWYRKTWVVPASMADKRIRVEFDGVYMDSSIYVNGTLVGSYPYGYSPFSYDITDYVAADGMTENVIAVRVNNTQPSSRWYSGSGIYRDVKLVATNPVHVDRYGTKITTPYLESEYTEGEPVTVNVDTEVANESGKDSNITLRHTAYFNGSLETPGSLDPVSTVTTEQAIVNSGAVENINTQLSIADAHLWEVGDGGMYSLHTEVLSDGVVIDTYDTDFGLRWMKFNSKNGFFLNGKYTKMQGVCQHHDQGALGAVNNPAALSRQIRILREMGVNAIRSSHNPASRALLDACNQQGIMVMNESFDTWWSSKNLYDFHRFFDIPCSHPDAQEGQTWQEYDIKNMVDGSKNDPSIIMWSIGNEIGESWSDKGLEVGSKLRQWVKEVDDTRAITQADPIFYSIDKPAYDPANNQAHWQLINGHDAMGFNYGQYTDYDYVHEKNPNWFIYSSETSSAVSTRGAYFHPEVDDDPDAGLHRDTYQCSEFDNDRVNWGTTLHYALREDAKRKYMGGLFFWTGFDYIGEPAPFAGGSSKSSYFGAIDTCGFPKDSFYLIQSQWLDEKTDPMVHILPHWNWEDDHSIDIDGKSPIRVYSNARSVEVFLNGESLGRKEFTYYPETDTSLARQDDGSDQENLYLQWLVPYEAGTVEAVAYDENGKEIARDVKTTAGDPAAIKLSPERQSITADGEDLCYIEVDVVDKEGVMNPRANNSIQFSISGNGRIVGTDNGDPTDFTNMKSTRRSAFNGKALVIVQSTEKSGSFTLKAVSAGLPISSTTVYTVDDTYEEDALLGYQQVSVRTKAGEYPNLPDTVTAEYLDGTSQEAAVTWEKIPEIQLKNAGILNIKGTVNRDGAAVKATVEVVAPVGVRPVSAVTAPGMQPALPEQVQLVYSDSSEEAYGVSWANIDGEDLKEGAQLTVEGTLEGRTDLKAEAVVRVAAMGTRQNIALAVKGAEYPKFTASHTSTYDPLSHVNDGIISYGTDPKNGWGNWKYAPIPEVTTLDCELEEPLELNNISMYFREDGGIYIPEDTLIQYWDGTDWVDVENQSQRTGFVSGSEQIITFDPVTTNKLRAQFTRGTQDTSVGKKDCLVLTEVEIYAFPPEKGFATAQLETLTVGGEAIEDFDPDQKDYTVTLPYGAKVPEVKATAADHGTVFVLPALTNQSAAMIQVASENGKVTETYTVQFQEIPASIVSASLRLEQDEVYEDSMIPIHVDAMLESGELADEENLRIKYRIVDGGIPARAEVKNGILYAYWEGNLQVEADITLNGQNKVTSAPLNIMILPGQSDKKIISYAQAVVDTKLNQAPKLPKTVRATYDVGLPRDVLVDWEPVDPAKYASYGTFTVSGTVENQALKPTVTVRVRDRLAAQNVSMVTPIGIVPKLPESVLVYFTDGTSTLSQVQWDDYDPDQLKASGTFTVNGSTQLGGFAVSASVRVTDDTVQSENHAKKRNGCPYSMAITSFSEGGSAVALNNGLLDKWTDWSNPNAQGDIWFGVIFGADYPETRYVDSIVLDLLNDSSWDRTKITSCTVEYYNQPITLEDVPQNVANFDAANMADHPFNNPDNWTQVTGLKQPEAYHFGENSLTFDMVEAPAIRVKTKHETPGDTYYTALKEMYAYGKQAVSNGSFSVSGLKVDGKEFEGFDPKIHEYLITGYDADIPALEMTADKNASITLLPATDINSEARFLITSEDGLKTETYTIRFKEKEIPVEQIRLTAGKDRIEVKEETFITAEVLPEEATNKEVEFSASPSDRVRLEADPANQRKVKVTGIKAGEVTITARAKNESQVFKEVKITVTEKPVEDIKVSGITLTAVKRSILVNEISQVTAQVAPENAKNKALSYSSSNPAVASVDQNGFVRGVNAGTATITAAAKDGSNVKGSIVMTVTAPVVNAEKVHVTPSKKTLAEGEKVTLKAVVKPSNVTVKGVNFKSSNKKIATVSSAGKVTAKRTGTAVITVISKDNSAKASVKITVTPKKVRGVKVEKVSSRVAKVSWKKVSGVNGYKVSVSTKKNGKYHVKARIKKSGKTSAEIKKLKKGKVYYIKVSTYKKVGKKTYITTPINSVRYKAK